MSALEKRMNLAIALTECFCGCHFDMEICRACVIVECKCMRELQRLGL